MSDAKTEFTRRPGLAIWISASASRSVPRPEQTLPNRIRPGFGMALWHPVPETCDKRGTDDRPAIRTGFKAPTKTSD
eukprot:3357063-Lingulodinium_polyedra.AAC.1